MRKMIIFVMAVVFILVLSSCAISHYAPSSPTEEVFEPGEYTVTVSGHNGDVEVAVTFDAYRVTKIEVLEQQESAGLGDAALQTVADAIIEKQSFEVDTVSGATYSSVAMLQAVALAAKEAGAQDVPEIDLESVVGQDESEETDQEEPIASLGYIPGTYTAVAMGMGEITVTVTVDEEKILSVTIEGPNETEGVGSHAVEELPAKIVAANSTQVDGVSGATITSDAIKLAVKDALSQASK